MTKLYSNSDLMKIAVEQHQRCEVFPKVGAVIAEDGILLSTGYRGEIDSQHAERIAIGNMKGRDLSRATLFTTLEPCVEIHDEQIPSCSDLIITSGLSKIFIGILDPNGSIYSRGFEKFNAHGIEVNFFNRKLQKEIKENTFKHAEIEKIVGGGKRRVPVIHSGTSLTVQFSETDDRTIDIRWSTLQLEHNIVDLHSGKDAVTVASGADRFDQITDPTVFNFPSHVSRMSAGMISIVKPIGATFCVLVKLLEIHGNDITFQCEVRKL